MFIVYSLMSLRINHFQSHRHIHHLLEGATFILLPLLLLLLILLSCVYLCVVRVLKMHPLRNF